jgi:predicted dehydrogenase
MRTLINNRWTDGFLDYHRGPEDYLLESAVWKNLERLRGLYFERPKSLWTIWNYLWDIGARQTMRKVLSRSQERYRNEKYAACGIGYVREKPIGSTMPLGQAVVFVAPCHPRIAERIALPAALLKPVDPAGLSFLPTRGLLCLPEPEERTDADRWWESVRAWSPHSGIDLSPLVVDGLLDRALDSLKNSAWKHAVCLRSGRRHPAQSSVAVTRPADGRRKSAVLFGYGNYSKNIILPNVQRYLDIRCIHEVDPLQIPLNRTERCGWDTAAEISGDEKYEVFLIAGFHHTHVPLAIRALHQGADVLVEKPIAVDRAQVAALIEAMGRSRGGIFCCFHKRYSPFNVFVREDLCLQPEEPVSYHCVVYEVPLPPDHWYRWPNSKSRLITNGCHWIDDFLFLNGYPEATAWDLAVAADRSAVNCSITLSNGAFFTMVMTYSGSERIGPQDYVELRANGRTIRIVNESTYLAETKHRVLRRRRLNKMHAYNRMYQEIGRRIILGGAGDSVASVKGAVELGLRLEECDARPLALARTLDANTGDPVSLTSHASPIRLQRTVST